jgi:hypothetical protein
MTMAELIAMAVLGAGIVITVIMVWHREAQRQAWWHHEMMTDARQEGYAEGWDAAVEFMKGSQK